MLIGVKEDEVKGGMTLFIFQQCIQDYNYSDACVLALVLGAGFCKKGTRSNASQSWRLKIAWRPQRQRLKRL